MIVSSTQFRMARCGLGLSAGELAAKVGIHKNTLLRIEKGEAAQAATLGLLQRVLEDAGAVFIDNPEAPAVGIRPTSTSGSNPTLPRR